MGRELGDGAVQLKTYGVIFLKTDDKVQKNWEKDIFIFPRRVWKRSMAESSLRRTQLHLGYFRGSLARKGLSGFNPWVRKIPWRRKWQPTPVLLPGKSDGWRSLVGYSPWGYKESDTTERLHFTFWPGR